MGCGHSQVKSDNGSEGGKNEDKSNNDSKPPRDKPRAKGKPYKQKLQNKSEDNIIETIFYGILADDAAFCDCLIRSNDELESKLRSFISHSLYDWVNTEEGVKPIVNYYPNSEDEILNQINLFDFRRFQLIAVRGAYIEKVMNDGGIYKVYTTDEIVASNEYCAAVIAIPQCNIKSSWIFAGEPVPTEDLLENVNPPNATVK
jgi:hypothetical protein